MLKNLIYPLGLTVRLGVESRQQALFDVQSLSQQQEKQQHKLCSLVGNDLLWQAMMGENLFQENGRRSLSRDRL